MVKCSIIDKMRQPKFIGMAVFDWVATFIFSVIIALLVNYFAKLDESFYITIIKTFIIMIFITILAHYAFGIPTMLNYYLGLNSLNAVLKLRKDC
jgi:hypothetical protein